jgi:hypothetical protein
VSVAVPYWRGPKRRSRPCLERWEGYSRHTALAQSRRCAGRSPPCRKHHPVAIQPSAEGEANGSPAPPASITGFRRSNPTGKSAGAANAGAYPPFSTILVPAATEIAADPGVQCDSWFGGLLNRRKHERNCATDDAPFSTILVPPATGIAADPWASNSYQHQHEAIYFPMGALWLVGKFPGAAGEYTLNPRLSSLVPPGRVMPKEGLK